MPIIGLKLCIHLNAAVRQGHVDLLVLDALGEAAYQTQVPEALGPYQNYYKYPLLAAHMARAFLMLGDRDSCAEFLGWAKDSALKFALLATRRFSPSRIYTEIPWLPFTWLELL